MSMSLRSFLFAGAFAAVLWGCNAAPTTTETNSSEPKPADPAATATSSLKPVEGQLKVALLTPGAVNDAGWSSIAFQGLKGIEAEGAKTSLADKVTGTKIKETMRAYAQEGYNLVLGHGFEYNDPGMELAKDFPNTVFVSSSGGKISPNCGAFRFYLEQGFYLGGVLAASVSKSGKIATVALTGIPSIDSTMKAFKAGAMSVNQDIQVITIGLQDGNDSAAAKQATLSAIGQGADVVIHQANNAAKGVFEACEEKGAFAIGANSDQNKEGATVLASAVISVKPVFMQLARDVKAGTYVGQIKTVGMKEEAVDFIFNPAQAGKIPAEVTSKIAEVRQQILDGKLEVPKDTF
jgi:basic membrane protein A and related proteins